MLSFSKDWTAEERLKLVLMLVFELRARLEEQGGKYNGAAVPNLTSITEVVIATPAQIETSRAYIDELVAKNKGELVDVRLEDLWRA